MEQQKYKFIITSLTLITLSFSNHFSLSFFFRAFKIWYHPKGTVSCLLCEKHRSSIPTPPHKHPQRQSPSSTVRNIQFPALAGDLREILLNDIFSNQR